MRVAKILDISFWIISSTVITKFHQAHRVSTQSVSHRAVVLQMVVAFRQHSSHLLKKFNYTIYNYAPFCVLITYGALFSDSFIRAELFQTGNNLNTSTFRHISESLDERRRELNFKIHYFSLNTVRWCDRNSDCNLWSGISHSKYLKFTPEIGIMRIPPGGAICIF